MENWNKEVEKIRNSDNNASEEEVSYSDSVSLSEYKKELVRTIQLENNFAIPFKSCSDLESLYEYKEQIVRTKNPTNNFALDSISYFSDKESDNEENKQTSRTIQHENNIALSSESYSDFESLCEDKKKLLAGIKEKTDSTVKKNYNCDAVNMRKNKKETTDNTNINVFSDNASLSYDSYYDENEYKISNNTLPSYEYKNKEKNEAGADVRSYEEECDIEDNSKNNDNESYIYNEDDDSDEILEEENRYEIKNGNINEQTLEEYSETSDTESEEDDDECEPEEEKESGKENTNVNQDIYKRKSKKAQKNAMIFTQNKKLDEEIKNATFIKTPIIWIYKILQTVLQFVFGKKLHQKNFLCIFSAIITAAFTLFYLYLSSLAASDEAVFLILSFVISICGANYINEQSERFPFMFYIFASITGVIKLLFTLGLITKTSILGYFFWKREFLGDNYTRRSIAVFQIHVIFILFIFKIYSGAKYAPYRGLVKYFYIVLFCICQYVYSYFGMMNNINYVNVIIFNVFYIFYILFFITSKYLKYIVLNLYFLIDFCYLCTFLYFISVYMDRFFINKTEMCFEFLRLNYHHLIR